MQERYEQFTQATQQEDPNLLPNDQQTHEFFTLQPSDQTAMDRVTSIFTSPKEAQQGIEVVTNPSKLWLVIILIACALTASYKTVRSYTTDSVIVEYQMKKQSKEMELNSPRTSPERKQMVRKELNELAPAPLTTTKSVLDGLLGILSVLAAFFLSAVVFYLIGKFIFGAEELTFNSILIASSLGFILSSVGDLFALGLESATGDSTLSFTPAVFFGTKLSFANMALLGQISLFKIWDLFAFGIGYASLIRRSTSTGLLVVFGTWLLRILIVWGAVYGATSYLS